jgi:hypothetical protein
MPTTKKPARKIRKSAKIHLTKAQRKRLADPASLFPEKDALAEKVARMLKEQGDL